MGNVVILLDCIQIWGMACEMV